MSLITEKYKESIKKGEEQLAIAIQKRSSFRPTVEIDWDHFTRLLKQNCNIVLARKNREANFMIDEYNTQVIRQLWLYFIGSKDFEGDLLKGILLAGGVGNGKTTLMSGFLMMYEQLANKIFTNIHAHRVADFQKSEPAWMKKPVYIDDLGKEEEEIKEYGSITRPLMEFIALRYEQGSLTFGSTNFKHETLVNKYTSHIVERIEETMNFIELPGESRRK